MIKNVTKGTVLSKQSRVARTVLQQAVGLMFQKPYALIFPFVRPKALSLHMWFVFWPIDVVYLNEQKRVIEIKENFKPWTVYTPKKNAYYLVELPQGTVKQTNTKKGDLLQLF